MTKTHHGRLTSTDASFLYFERREAPMHIGALCLFDGYLDYEQYVEWLATKIPRLDRFRERLVAPPLYLGHPTWETAPDFEIRDHVLLHEVEAPGGAAELKKKVDEILEGMLDRSRPLWELHILDGLADGKSAMVSKIHHAMVDGVGGNAILTTILDFKPNAETPKPVENGYEPTQPPSRQQRANEAFWEGLRSNIDAWSSYLGRWTEVGRNLDRDRLRTAVEVLASQMPELAIPPRRLPFNRRCGGKRSFVTTDLAFAEARAIRGQLGGTVNDVILAALGRAVGRYAAAHGESIKGREMRVMCPVNVRREEDSGALGNQVSMLPVGVPLDVEDPEKRIRVIHNTTRALKGAHVAEGISMMVDIGAVVPAPAQALFGSVAWSPFPPFNIVCTNVPGPQIPLYALGVPLKSYYPYVPLGFDMGAAVAVFSYNQRLFFGLNSDTRACSDIEMLRDYLSEAFSELKAAAGVADIVDVVTSRPRRVGTVSDRMGEAQAVAPKGEVSTKGNGAPKERSQKGAETASPKPAVGKKAKQSPRPKSTKATAKVKRPEQQA